MYDYVLQLLYDDETTNEITELKNILVKNNIENNERPWLPHITIDLYYNVNSVEFISILDNFIKIKKQFNFEFDKLGKIDKGVLFLVPNNIEELVKIKEELNIKLDKYRINDRRNKDYIPHSTLTINKDVTYAEKLLSQNFAPIKCTVKYLCIYNSDMELIKKYEL